MSNHYSNRKLVRSEEFKKNRYKYALRTYKIIKPYMKKQEIKLLDVGADIGISMLCFEKMIPKAKITGIEPSEYAVSEAKKNIKRAKSKTKIVQGDGTEMPFKDESFDLVLCEQILEHVKTKHKMIDEMYRVLKPGGILFVSIPNRVFPYEPHLRLPFIHWPPKEIGMAGLSKRKKKGYKHLYLISSIRMEKMLKRTFNIRYVSQRFFDRDIIKTSPNFSGFKYIAYLLRPFLKNRVGAWVLKIIFPYGGFICKKRKREMKKTNHKKFIFPKGYIPTSYENYDNLRKKRDNTIYHKLYRIYHRHKNLLIFRIIKRVYDSYKRVYNIFFFRLGYNKIYKLNKGDVMIDAGAFPGDYIEYASKKVGKSGLVIGYEPNPDNFAVLERNVKKMRKKNIIILQKGLWNKKDKLKFWKNKMGSTVHYEGKNKDLIQVEVNTVDSEVERLGLSRVDFIKMDIEGAEIEAVQGCEQTMKKFSPIFSIASYHLVDNQQTYVFLEKYFQDRDYDAFTFLSLLEKELITYAKKKPVKRK